MADTRMFSGQTAFVTGSSRGIGRVIATHLANLGASVAIHGTTPTSARAFGEGDSLEALARTMAADTKSTIVPVHGDLADPAAVTNVLRGVRAALGRIDILVNCAGGDIGAGGTGAPQAGRPTKNDAVFISMEDLRSVLDRNLMTCLLVCREAAPEMIARKSGRIINIGSIAGLAGFELGAIYATAKAAVHEYTRCLATQLRPYDVTVNAIAAGRHRHPSLRGQPPHRRFHAGAERHPGALRPAGRGGPHRRLPGLPGSQLHQRPGHPRGWRPAMFCRVARAPRKTRIPLPALRKGYSCEPERRSRVSPTRC